MSSITERSLSKSVLAIVLGGGRGSRLHPLTKERSKPAVPLAGKYRLVDIPISNCISAGIRRVFVLTQFNSASLHRHIAQTYSFDPFNGGFVEILAAEQTPTQSTWFQGTADAVRRNLTHFLNNGFEHALILSGDQLYQMDFLEFARGHVESNADLTVATIPVEREAARGFGIMKIDAERKIDRFVEKPQQDDLLNSLSIDPSQYGAYGIETDRELFLASMGIYMFKRDVMLELLDNDLTDFGKDIIPSAIDTHNVRSYVYQGYWEDIGTIKSFFDANINFTSAAPNFDFFDARNQIFTRPRFLPATKVFGSEIDESILSDGSVVQRAKIEQSVVGIRSFVGEGASLSRVIMMGCDYYETETPEGMPPLGVGAGSVIENAIIDKNARIGKNCRISPEGKEDFLDGQSSFVRDGIVIIPKGAVIPDNTTI